MPIRTFVLQLTSLKAILELARSGNAKPFEPEVFCTALEVIICSTHTSIEFLSIVNSNFVDHCDIR